MPLHANGPGHASAWWDWTPNELPMPRRLRKRLFIRCSYTPGIPDRRPLARCAPITTSYLGLLTCCAAATLVLLWFWSLENR